MRRLSVGLAALLLPLVAAAEAQAVGTLNRSGDVVTFTAGVAGRTVQVYTVGSSNRIRVNETLTVQAGSGCTGAGGNVASNTEVTCTGHDSWRIVLTNGADTLNQGAFPSGGISAALPMEVEGRDGNDTLTGGAGNDRITPGLGDDGVVNGGAGTQDTISYDDGRPRGVTVNLDDASQNDGGPDDGGGEAIINFENLVGSNGDDRLDGGPSNEIPHVISGRRGNDNILGSRANDTLNGQEGNDTINGRNRSDTIDGGPGSTSRATPAARSA